MSTTLPLSSLMRSQTMQSKYPKVYAEKLLYLKEGQYSPNHFHWYKTEDIINRGGGNVLIRVYNSHPDESIDYKSDVTVHTDGRTYTVPAGTQIRLTPGESILYPAYQRGDVHREGGDSSGGCEYAGSAPVTDLSVRGLCVLYSGLRLLYQ